VKEELPNFPDHPSSSPLSVGVHVAQSLVSCMVFCRALFVILYSFACQLTNAFTIIASTICKLCYTSKTSNASPIIASTICTLCYMSKTSNASPIIASTICTLCYMSKASNASRDIRGGFRGGVRGVRPPKIRKAYAMQR
jgi:hypothetical protein